MHKDTEDLLQSENAQLKKLQQIVLQAIAEEKLIVDKSHP